MAKYAKRKKRATHRRRRRVGALALSPSSPLVMYGSIAAGFFLGDKINDAILKAVGTSIDGKLVGAAEAGLGGLLVFGGGKKQLIKTLAGGVLLGAGAKKLLKEFGVMNGIGGYGRVPVVGRHRMNGYGRVPVVGYTGGYTPSSMLAGALNGFDGLTVPRSPHKQVVGSAYRNGSGINPDDK